LILLDALEDLLFTEIGVPRRGGDVAPLRTGWRDSAGKS
jgi:hypothetical protein